MISFVIFLRSKGLCKKLNGCIHWIGSKTTFFSSYKIWLNANHVDFYAMKIYILSSSTDTGMNSRQFAPLWYDGTTRGHRDEITQAQKSPGYFHPRTPGRACLQATCQKLAKDVNQSKWTRIVKNIYCFEWSSIIQAPFTTSFSILCA